MIPGVGTAREHPLIAIGVRQTVDGRSSVRTGNVKG